jgi:DNA-binding GntR family transcriptional regulator
MPGVPVEGDGNVTALVYEKVRSDLLTCRLAPSSRVSVLGLSRRMEVSQSSVREALSRLTAEGLVSPEPNRGFVVAPVSLERFQSLSKARTSIDALCLRDAIGAADVELEVELMAASHRVLRRLELLSNDSASTTAYLEAHGLFHETLVSRCSNPWLIWMRRLLFAQSVRYRHYCLPFARDKAEFYDHRGAFLRAVFARDADRAEALLTEHYEQVCNRILAALKDKLPAA